MSPPAHRLATTFALLAFGPLAAGQMLFGPAKVTKPLPLTDTYVGIGAADVDGDDLLDLVRPVDLEIRWHKGDGTGAFAATGTLIPGVSGNRIGLVDLNGDGRRDLLAVTFSTATLDVALADAESGFDEPVVYDSPPSPLNKLVMAAGDADADGDADVVLVAQGTLGGDPGEAWLLLNDGTGALTLGPIVPGDSTHLLAEGFVVSVDGDVWPDLVLVSGSAGQQHETTVWQGQPGGGMDVSFRAQNQKALCTADLDSDGDIDFAASTNTFLAPVFVSTFLGDGRGDFAAGPVTDVHLAFPGVVDIDLADLDDDGWPDLVMGVPLDGSEWFLPGDGTGGFGEPDAHVTLHAALPFAGTQIAALDDFDLDGRPDVLCYAPHEADVAVALNETYPSGGPLLDHGHQHWQNAGWPILIASGSFVGSTAYAFDLYRAGPDQLVFPVIGFSVLEAPFKGGIMVPTPQIIAGPLPAAPSGEIHLAAHWPTGVPSGFPIVLQFWISAPASPGGFGASSGVVITAP